MSSKRSATQAEKGGSFRQYSNSFRPFILQLISMNSSHKVDRLIRGLKDKNVKAQVLLKKPASLEEAIQFAEVLDSVYYSINNPGQHSLSSSNQINPDFAMDLDFMQTVQPQQRYTPLTAEEKRALTESGGCVYCRARDHSVANCPKLAERNRRQSGNGVRG